MKSWKTSLSGLISALVIALYPVIKTGSFTAETVLVAAGVAVVGFFAKDSTAYTADKDKAIEDQAKTIAYKQADHPAQVDNYGQAIAK